MLGLWILTVDAFLESSLFRNYAKMLNLWLEKRLNLAKVMILRNRLTTNIKTFYIDPILALEQEIIYLFQALASTLS